MKLQLKAPKTDDEVRNKDWVMSLDFKDWFKFVRLKSQKAYSREGRLMSHCVGGYFGRNNVEIHSLRDDKNNPHCTIELVKEWSRINQIKWKGNGSIDPKYIDYVVKFLEKKGKTIRDYDMKNLGYRTIDYIPFAEQLWLKAKAYRGRFVHETKMEIFGLTQGLNDYINLAELPGIIEKVEQYKWLVSTEWWDDPERQYSIVITDAWQYVLPSVYRTIIQLQNNLWSSFNRTFHWTAFIWKVNWVINYGNSSLIGNKNTIYGGHRNAIIGDGNMVYGSGCIKWHKNIMFGAWSISWDYNQVHIMGDSTREMYVQGSNNKLMMSAIPYNLHLTVLNWSNNVITYFHQGKTKTILLEPMTQYRFNSRVWKHKIRIGWWNNNSINVLSKWSRSFNQIEWMGIDTSILLPQPIWSTENSLQISQSNT